MGEIVVKALEPKIVISIREILPTYSEIGRLYGEIYQYLELHHVEPDYCGAIWHDSGYKEQDVDGEAIIFIHHWIPGHGRIKVYELPGCQQAACITHYGSYQTMINAYTDIMKWIEQHNHQIVGASREVYLHGGPEQDNNSYITEIQFPIAEP